MSVESKPSKFVFLCGSSCVGKTSIMESFPISIATTHDVWKVEKIQMNVTDIRAQIGNPSWEDLMKDPKLAQWQQDHILEVYRKRISDIVAKEENNKIYLFERCELDANGYSSAFKVDKMPIQQMQFPYINYYIIHRPIDTTLVYNETANRPPEIIRDDCATYISGITHTYGSRIPIWNNGNLKLDNNKPNTYAYNVYHSLNEGTAGEQLQKIIRFILH